VKFTAAFGTLLIKEGANKKIVVGRDGRISGALVKDLVISTLKALGLNVIDLDYSTTPTVEMAVVFENAGGGHYTDSKP
jgi:phosphomannomutase